MGKSERTPDGYAQKPYPREEGFQNPDFEVQPAGQCERMREGRPRKERAEPPGTT